MHMHMHMHMHTHMYMHPLCGCLSVSLFLYVSLRWRTVKDVDGVVARGEIGEGLRIQLAEVGQAGRPHPHLKVLVLGDIGNAALRRKVAVCRYKEKQIKK
jgi:hypothetical protein